MAFTLRGQVTCHNGNVHGLFVEVFGYDRYSGRRLATGRTTSDGHFTAFCNVESGYDVGFITVCDRFSELFRKEARDIPGWDNLNLQITVADDSKTNDPYNNSDARVIRNFIDSARDIVDWNKVDRSRLLNQTNDFVNDWIACADPDSLFYKGPPPPTLPRRPSQEAHNDT